MDPSLDQYRSPHRHEERDVLIHQLRLFADDPVPVAPDYRLPLRRKLLHLTLFLLTLSSTAFVGVFWFGREGDSLWRMLGSGLIYAFTIMVILTAHEMGHYIACRWYRVEASWPYFIPLPFSPVGTLGAFIRMRPPIPNRRALFDIGIAGPLAGFVFIVPTAIVAHYFAGPALTIESTEGMIYLQSPLLFRFFEWLFGLPETVELSPVMWAAWVGALMTSLNLLPVGQLDGGHVTWAVFGPRGHRLIMMISWASVIGLAIYSALGGVWNWVIYAVMLTILARVGHPPVLDEQEPLGTERILVAIIGLLVFILCFMPAPISFN